MNNSGRHVTADAYLHKMPSNALLMEACEAAIERSGMHIIAVTYKAFEPQGLTAVWILSESHFSIHTYPEHLYISIDCYTCGDEGQPDAAVHTLLDLLEADRSHVCYHTRGMVIGQLNASTREQVPA